MYDDNFKNRIYLRAKESFIIGFLLIMAILVFIIPIGLIFLLRFIFKVVLKNEEEKVVSEESIYANKLKTTSNN